LSEQEVPLLDKFYVIYQKIQTVH